MLAGELTEQSDAFVTLLSTLQPLIMSTGNVPATGRHDAAGSALRT